VSPISAFVRDECHRGAKCEIEVGELYKAWKDWCEGNGVKPGSVQTFGSDLRAAVPELRGFKPHGKKRRYAGITLTTHNGASRGSSGSEESAEPGEPHEPLENPLWPTHRSNGYAACEVGGDLNACLNNNCKVFHFCVAIEEEDGTP
jgi:phage/plasmid-associated DNA primase